MKNTFRILIAPAVICWCFFSFTGCKNPAIEDKDLLTKDDYLNLAKDTLHVKVFSEFEQPVNASAVSVGLLGTLTDPNFGSTYSSFYARFRLTSNNLDFGLNPEIDSAVLTLKYYNSYGKLTLPQNVKVYELTESMIDSVTYKSNQTFNHSNVPLGTKNNFIPNFTNDTLTALNGFMPAHLRIGLDKVWANRILNDTAALADDNAFANFFKGIYLSTASSTTGDGITYFDLSSAATGITLFYHNNTDDSLYYTLPVSGTTLNHFDNYYTGTPVQASVSRNNAANSNVEEKMYLQTGAGVKGKILITDLDSLPKNIIINKAELVVSQADGDTLYPAPDFVDLFRIDDAGQPKVLEDYNPLNSWGQRKYETVNGITYCRYRFNFKKYFQLLIQGVWHNNGFYLETYSPESKADRLVISNSSTNKNYQISIEVIYTKL